MLCDLHPRKFLERVRQSRDAYDGFNLLVAADGELLHYANVRDDVTTVTPGVHGLSNHLLNTPWPKVQRGKAALQGLVAGPPEVLTAGLLDALGDTRGATEEELPRTGVSLEWERQLARIFIHAPGYGTRASTVVLSERFGNLAFIERNFAPDAQPIETRTLQFSRVPSGAASAWTFA